MAAALEQAVADLKRLRGKPEAADSIRKIKIAVVTLNVLDSTKPQQPQVVTLARSALEEVAYHAIAARDFGEFTRTALQLRPLYANKRSGVQDSANENLILALYLLSLLSQDKTAEFYSELEKFALSTLEKDKFMTYTTILAQCLMEGSYSKALRGLLDPPHELMKPFTVDISNTIRRDIAACCLKACDTLALKDLTRMLMLENSAQGHNEAVALLKSLNFEVPQGATPDTVLAFKPPKVAGAEYPAFEMVDQAMEYAKELERIV